MARFVRAFTHNAPSYGSKFGLTQTRSIIGTERWHSDEGPATDWAEAWSEPREIGASGGILDVAVAWYACDNAYGS